LRIQSTWLLGGTLPYSPIEAHGVIGDLSTIALVCTNGTIDFLCLPEFDSPTCFASLLDEHRGGYFSLHPRGDAYTCKQIYLPDTNVLLTRFLSEELLTEVFDFMAISAEGQPQFVVRMVHSIKGTAEFVFECRPALDYARVPHRAAVGENVAEFIAQNDEKMRFRLCWNLGAKGETRADDGGAAGSFTLNKDEWAYLIFEHSKQGEPLPDLSHGAMQALLAATQDYWRAWVSQSRYRGRWREMVNRSALALKLLTSRKYGSMVAAGTFGLPETFGGERNWDYRYTWLRDASFALYALSRLGFTEESHQFMGWLRDRVTKSDGQHGPLQTMYSIRGETKLDEYTLGQFSGYRDSRPVRVGNAAYSQLQLDIYGELMDAIYLATKYGDALPYQDWKDCQDLIAYVEENWRKPDEGIWEVRAGRKEYLHSRVMCWVAVDRAIRLAYKRSLPAPLEEWQNLRNDIYGSVFADFWNEDLHALVAYRGADYVDASALLMPLMRFISPADPKWLGTLKAIECNLVEDARVYRYKEQNSEVDGLRGTEGSFTACSFWYAECLARCRQTAKAHGMFERALSYGNHLGLFAEELGTSGRHQGNFPQALTHLALISAAYYLDKDLAGELGAWR
jgi:GH15 family glucan-1,4-alpha-glucosidase